MVDIGIVIVNYNTVDDLRRCLISLQGNTGIERCRVVVVDNRSSDGSPDMVQCEHPWVWALICNPENVGYARANNIGLRQLGFTQGEPREGIPRYALLLNPDTVLPPDALQKMLAFMDAHPDVGIAGPKLVRPDGTLDWACRRSFPTPSISFYRLSGLSKLFPKSRRFGRYNLTFLDVDRQADVDAVVGAFMLIRREALEQAGLLDEAFFMYGEDLDLCYRVKAHGWRVVYYPVVTVLHVKGAASRKNSYQATRAFYQAMKIFHDKHYRAQTPMVINWLLDAGVALLGVRAVIANHLRPSGKRRVGSA